MKLSESQSQPDLFAVPAARPKLFDYVQPDYMLAIRRPQAEQMLKLVQEATSFPWANLTIAMSEEMRFNGMVRLFPPAEGRALLEAYAKEITRLYALIDEPWEPLYYAVLKKNYD